MTIVQINYQNHSWVHQIYRPFYSQKNRGCEQAIRKTMEYFSTTHTLSDNTHPQRRHLVRTEGNAAMERSVEKGPIRAVILRFVERVCRNISAYKMQLVQELP